MLESAQKGEFQWSTLIPSSTDRAVFVGQTGCGKTTLARYLLESRRYKVVADYKGRIDWPGYTVCRTVKELRKRKEPSLIYRPNEYEMVDEDKQNEFWYWIYKRGETTAYADEVNAFARGNRYPFYYGACIMRGRELGVEVWSGTQRPTWVPGIILSESEHYYAFYLKMEQDRERVESLCGVDRDLLNGLPKRRFYYSRQDSGAIGPITLSLSNNP